jgi:Ni/Fe-hydrogenase subunit HybB-like protein
VTGGLEIMSAVLIALPAIRIVGLALGAAIIAAAVMTVLRHRDFSHLVPLGVFVALLALAGTLS